MMMACNRRVEACAATERTKATAWRVSAALSPDRISPNSGSTAPLLGNTDSGHCAYKAAHDHIQAVDTHIIFPTAKATMRSWRWRSPYRIEQAPVGRAHLSRPCCGSTNLNYTGSNMQVLSQGLQRTSNGVTPWPVG
jgi:hypothetical protein